MGKLKRVSYIKKRMIIREGDKTREKGKTFKGRE
jgi:hypothetical protein